MTSIMKGTDWHETEATPTEKHFRLKRKQKTKKKPQPTEQKKTKKAS